MKKLLIVDNSPFDRERLAQVLRADPRFEVVCQLSSSQELMPALMKSKPDLLLLDVDSVKSGGVDTVELVMAHHPLPTVVLSSNPKLDRSEFLKAGALAASRKPPLNAHLESSLTEELRTTIALMAEVKVVTRRCRPRRQGLDVAPNVSAQSAGARIIAVGASTGGPSALASLLTGLHPSTTPYSILVAQHISPGFISGLIDWLNDLTDLNIVLAQSGTVPQPGHVYFAPDDHQYGFQTNRRTGETVLSLRRAKSGEICPSVDILFQAVASFFGGDSAGILLTGMGRDGAKGLMSLRESGALTIAQSEASCAVYGMPAEAVRLGAVSHQLDLDRIRKMFIDVPEKSQVS